MIFFGFCGEREIVYVCVRVYLKLIFSEVLYHNGKSNLRHFFSCFLCYNYVMVPFFSFLSRHYPSPSSGPPHFIIEFVYPSCWLIVFLLASFGNLLIIIFLCSLSHLSLPISSSSKWPFPWLKVKNKIFFFCIFFFLAAIFSVCNLGKIINYQIMINYIIHYIHGGSQTIKKYVPRPLHFLVWDRERIWQKKHGRKSIPAPLGGCWFVTNDWTNSST